MNQKPNKNQTNSGLFSSYKIRSPYRLDLIQTNTLLQLL